MQIPCLIFVRGSRGAFDIKDVTFLAVLGADGVVRYLNGSPETFSDGFGICCFAHGSTAAGEAVSAFVFAGGGHGDDNDLSFGGAGDDVPFDDLGNDELHGGSGDDILFGGDAAGVDRLYGDDGNDVLIADTWDGRDA